MIKKFNRLISSIVSIVCLFGSGSSARSKIPKNMGQVFSKSLGNGKIGTFDKKGRKEKNSKKLNGNRTKKGKLMGKNKGKYKNKKHKNTFQDRMSLVFDNFKNLNWAEFAKNHVALESFLSFWIIYDMWDLLLPSYENSEFNPEKLIDKAIKGIKSKQSDFSLSKDEINSSSSHNNPNINLGILEKKTQIIRWISEYFNKSLGFVEPKSAYFNLFVNSFSNLLNAPIDFIHMRGFDSKLRKEIQRFSNTKYANCVRIALIMYSVCKELNMESYICYNGDIHNYVVFWGTYGDGKDKGKWLEANPSEPLKGKTDPEDRVLDRNKEIEVDGESLGKDKILRVGRVVMVPPKEPSDSFDYYLLERGCYSAKMEDGSTINYCCKFTDFIDLISGNEKFNNIKFKKVFMPSVRKIPVDISRFFRTGKAWMTS